MRYKLVRTCDGVVIATCPNKRRLVEMKQEGDWDGYEVVSAITPVRERDNDNDGA